MNKLFIISGVVAVVLLAFLPSKPALANAICAPYASKQCISNIAYWYNSCGVLQDIYQNCNLTKQVCQNGQCVNPVYVPPQGGSHYAKSCYNNNLYWYNAQGMRQDIYQNCTDNNQCTLDSCSTNKCLHTLKCDGSTCMTNSPDYMKYCTGNNPGGTPNGSTDNGNPNQNMGNSLVVSIFGTKGSSMNLEKNMSVLGNDTVNFLLIIKNDSTTPVDNVSVKTDVTNNVQYTGNLTIDNVSSAGSIVSGISLGTIPAKTSKVISFTGTAVQPADQNAPPTTSQVTANVISGNVSYDSDYLAVNISPKTSNSGTSASTISQQGSSLVNNFSQNWYIWIIIVIILIVVFVIIFRRLSTNT